MFISPMEANECFIASVGKDWQHIYARYVHMNLDHQLQRTVTHGGEGDDLHFKSEEV